jgi:hypothetical protein
MCTMWYCVLPFPASRPRPNPHTGPATGLCTVAHLTHLEPSQATCPLMRAKIAALALTCITLRSSQHPSLSWTLAACISKCARC